MFEAKQQVATKIEIIVCVLHNKETYVMHRNLIFAIIFGCFRFINSARVDPGIPGDSLEYRKGHYNGNGDKTYRMNLFLSIDRWGIIGWSGPVPIASKFFWITDRNIDKAMEPSLPLRSIP